MTSRKQGKSRARLKKIIDARRVRRAKRRESEQVTAGPVEQAATAIGMSFGYLFSSDQAECWEQAKRRKQGREKTVALYHKHMEERGWVEAALPEGV